MPSWTSPRASASTLPISRVSAWARRSLCWARSAPKAYMISPRLGAGVARQAGSASSAARTAAATSAASDAAKWPIRSRLSAGFLDSNVRPLSAGRHSPPMKLPNDGALVVMLGVSATPPIVGSEPPSGSNEDGGTPGHQPSAQQPQIEPVGDSPCDYSRQTGVSGAVAPLPGPARSSFEPPVGSRHRWPSSGPGGRWAEFEAVLVGPQSVERRQRDRKQQQGREQDAVQGKRLRGDAADHRATDLANGEEDAVQAHDRAPI